MKILPEHLKNLSPEENQKLALLQGTLSISVPLYIEKWKNSSPEQRVERARECAQIVAEKGDVILFRTNKKGDSAKAFNALAEGIALLSFAPGGVTIFGLHFEE